eukprot:scaffold39973_cov30-Tisochrysis_lutea.AAC.5
MLTGRTAGKRGSDSAFEPNVRLVLATAPAGLAADEDAIEAVESADRDVGEGDADGHGVGERGVESERKRIPGNVEAMQAQGCQKLVDSHRGMEGRLINVHLRAQGLHRSIAPLTRGGREGEGMMGVEEI